MPPKKKTTKEQHHVLEKKDPEHPLHGKTVVFKGTFKTKKNVLETQLFAVGGKTTTNVSSKTTHVVKGKNAGIFIIEATFREIPVWTEDEFHAVCKDGWSAVPPPQPILPQLQCLVENTELDDTYRKELISQLTYDFGVLSGDTRLTGYARSSFRMRSIGSISSNNKHNIGRYGATFIVPIIHAWPAQDINFTCENLKDVDVKITMDAIVARGDDLPPLTTVDLSGNPLITDEGAFAIAAALPSTSLESLDMSWTNVKKNGVRAILKAIEKVPTMNYLIVTREAHAVNEGVNEVYKEWKKGSGKDCVCTCVFE